MGKRDPERHTAKTQRDSGGAAEAQKSAGPTQTKRAGKTTGSGKSGSKPRP